MMLATTRMSMTFRRLPNWEISQPGSGIKSPLIRGQIRGGLSPLGSLTPPDFAEPTRTPYRNGSLAQVVPQPRILLATVGAGRWLLS